jgi:thiol-disulfide isomerase/thioredoxin
MKKHLIVFTITILLLTGSRAQTVNATWFSVKGFLPQWNNADVQLLINGALVYNDTVREDLFSYTGKVAATQEGLLKITQNKQTVFLPFFIEPGTIKIRDEGRKLVVYGTATNEEYQALTHQFDSLALLKSNMRFEEIKQYKRDLATSYILEKSASPISLKLLADYFYLEQSANDTLYYRLYNSLDTSLQKSFTGKKLEQDVKQRYAVANGRLAPLLTLPDSSHQLLPVYQSGHFTLLNFWASWCLPCKREHPTLLRLFKQFYEQGFTIVGISLDTDRAAWLKAVQTEGLEWLQLSDLKGWSSPAATRYSVKLIPYNILLDANGTIIGKNLRMEEIESILAKRMGPQPY